MNVTIHIGWWLMPLICTVGVLAIANHFTDKSPAYDYGAIGQGLGNAIVWLLGVLGILIVWFVYVLWLLGQP